MKHTGVWIDQDKAYIVSIDNEVESFNTLKSNIEYYRPKGGSGTKFKGGPQDVVQDSKYLERKKHQLKHYFNEIVKEIKETDALVIFGPAGTNEAFSKALHANHNQLSAKIKGVEKADSMTEN